MEKLPQTAAALKRRELLENLTMSELMRVADCFHWRHPVPSVNAPGSRDENGPQGLTVSLFGGGLVTMEGESAEATAFTSEDVMTATFNTELMYRVGQMIAYDCLDASVSCLYGPGANTHRTPYGGRGGIMTAYTRWGTTWSGFNQNLMSGILRGEWGNQAMYITDNILTEYCDASAAIVAGGVTCFDAMMSYATDDLKETVGGENPDPIVVNALVEAMHHNLYTIINSAAMNGVGEHTIVKATTPKILGLMKIVTVVLGVLSVLFIALWVLGSKKLQKTEEYAVYKTAKRNYKAGK